MQKTMKKSKSKTLKMDESSKKHTDNANESQKSILLEFIKTNPEIVNSKLSNADSRIN